MEFIAFKSGKKGIINGDAFYIEIKAAGKRKNILVDGGWKRSGFTDFFCETTKKNFIHVVVCTHADADHTSGIIDILTHNKVKVGEIWLPSKWVDLVEVYSRYRDLEVFREDVLRDISRNFTTVINEENNELDNRTFGEIKRYNNKNRSEFNVNNDEINPLEEILKIIKSGKSSELRREIICVEYMIKNGLYSKVDILYLKVLKTLNKIIEIAKLAIYKNVRVRWFEYQCVTNVNKKVFADDPLIPLNSVEIFKVKRNSAGVKMLIKTVLSRANKESLVFQTNNIKSNLPPILLTSDSNLDLNEVKFAMFTKGMIITTPHHGSKNNLLAFKRLETTIKKYKINKVQWVRGHNSSVTVGPWYTKEVQLYGRKYCTKCEESNIKYIAKRNKWVKVQPSTFSDKCNC